MLKIELEKVGLKNGRTILENIFTEIPSNSVCSIIGKNGSGKTTLIKSLTSLLDNNLYSVEGKVIYSGKDIFTMMPKAIRALRNNNIKYVFQDAINCFDPLKTFKFYFTNLCKKVDEIDSLLSYFLLPTRKELSELYPYEVSGGMAQRINYILALSAKPDIIILDEPTSGIDPAIANLFIESIRKFSEKENHSVILVTHDLTFAEKVSDAVAFLDNKSLSEFLPPDKFFSLNNNSNLDPIINSYKQIAS